MSGGKKTFQVLGYSFRLHCLVDGEATSNAFSVEIDRKKTVGHLKKLIKAEKTPELNDVAADKLILWRVSIPTSMLGTAITLKNLVDNTELSYPRTLLSSLFPENPGDDTCVLVRDLLSQERTFATESDLYGIFRVDVGSVRSLPPSAITLGSFGLHRGTPDLVCMRGHDQSILFPFEMKRPVELSLDGDTSYVDAYQAQGSLSQGLAGPLRQIFGYMRLNGFHYGVLSTYSQTWFFKRASAHGDDILVSTIIQFDRTGSTLLQCYLWLIRAADNDAEWQPDIPDEASVEAMLSKEQPKDKDAKRDSDFDPARREKLKLGIKNDFTQSRATKQTRSIQTERRTIPTFKNLRPITFGEGVRTFQATWMGNEVVVKKADIWNRSSISDELEHEATVYEELQTLQGCLIPKLLLAGVVDGMEMVLATEFTGTDLHNKPLDASDRDKIRMALSAIHDLGVLHGDIRAENVTTKLDRQESRFYFIDFGRSKFVRQDSVLDCEMEKLEALLDLMPWPEGKVG